MLLGLLVPAQGEKELTPLSSRHKLIGRHLVGRWKNTTDRRYFGSIHLAVLAGEATMRGHYTSLANDLEVGVGDWHWVRIEQASIEGLDMRTIRLRTPREIYDLLRQHDRRSGALSLTAVTEE